MCIDVSVIGKVDVKATWVGIVSVSAGLFGLCSLGCVLRDAIS